AISLHLHGEMHDRHGPADVDWILAASNGGFETGDIPIEDLVGRSLRCQSGTRQHNQSNDARRFCDVSRAVSHDNSSLVISNGAFYNPSIGEVSRSEPHLARANSIGERLTRPEGRVGVGEQSASLLELNAV